MEQLQNEYTKYGSAFKVIKREGLVVIAEQRNEESDKVIGYEVFEVQQLPDQYVGPNRYFKSAREVPPGSETWGVKGFTCWNLEDAEKRFEQIKERLALRDKKK